MSRTDFFDLPHYQSSPSEYRLLPFRFERFGQDDYLLTTDFGDFTFVDAATFNAYVEKRLDTNSNAYRDLRTKNLLIESTAAGHPRIAASRYRTKKAFLDGHAKLHIFVVTLRCDHSCPYCQVSRQSEDKVKFDMTPEVAERGVDMMLSSPAPSVTCEFQGGESLLNFGLIEHIVSYATARNETIGKDLRFVVCTNLSTLTDAHLACFKEHGIAVSTSLDGPAAVHDKNRPFSKGSSHAVTERNIRRVQEALGADQVSALMTATKESLKHPRAIIDEYMRLGLGSIFLRALSPFGFATKTVKAIGYDMAEFIQFYKEALTYIIELNRAGRRFPEWYATLILRKLLTPFATGFVDLQSPSGAGFSVLVYNYDGDVYASDESRMLAEMGDNSFRLGSLLEDTRSEILFGERMQEIAAASCNEALAGCSDCALQPFCGADPVYHYATQGDMFGHRPSSGFCQKNMAIIRHLLQLWRTADDELRDIVWSWIRGASVAEVRPPVPQWLPLQSH